ncbi:MAG: DUF3574 domain-containing protein, partial [Okeania sp. SIO2F4]|uniref:DUF3574 domain-containing protein n=1 Tax=Okeania sp. SIO2F4 TaxID=2607790 RepID=UPI00142A5058
EDTEANETAIQEVLTTYQEEFNGAGVAQVIDEDIESSLDPRILEPTAPFIQQDLYFGLSRPDGSEVSQAEFETFLDDVIAPSFAGLTLFDGQGQVRDGDTILTEPSKVVTLLLEDTAENEAAVNQVVSEYAAQFGGAGVLEVVNKDDFQVSFGIAEDLIENDPTPELIQADLYFGRNFDGGEVSDEQFQTFVSNEIASRFIGLTHFDAQGRVRDEDNNILSERSKVVTLLLEDTEANETAIQEVLGLYQQEFSGSGVAQTVNEDVAIAFEVVEDIIENDPTPEIVQADLYFGRNFEGGEVSDEQIQSFVTDEIISRFPGLTEFDAQGQVGDNAERSKVVTLLLEDTEANETAIQEVLTTYQEEFNGAGVAQVIDEDIETSLDATTSGADNVEGDADDDLISGLGGDDTIAGFAGNDELLGNRGNDSINGGAGDDTLKGGYENDTLKGGSGEDSLIGWIGNDALLGGSGDDNLSGGQGRDRLNGGEGDDTLTGGASKDKFIFAANQAFSEVELGVDEITDFVSGQDTILLDLTTFTAITTEAGASLGDEFATVDGLVEESEAIIVYNSIDNGLYYNANGSEAGFGDGGLFAIISDEVFPTVDDFLIRA